MSRLFKTLLAVIPALLLIAFGFVFYYLPHMVGSEEGLRRIKSYLTESLGAEVHVESLTLHWRGDQEAQNITLKKGDKTVTIDSISLDVPLLSLLFRPNDPWELLLLGPLKISGIVCKIENKPPIHIPKIEGYKEDDSHVFLRMDTKTGKKSGSLSVLIAVKNPDNWQFTLHAFPSELFSLWKYNIPFSTFLGPTLTGSLDCHINDSLHDWKVNLLGQNIKITGEGNYNGAVNLSSPLVIDWILTSEASDYLFANLSVKPISAKSIHINVEPSGTSIPIKEFSWQTLRIPSASINLGKINCRNFGTLSALLSLIELRPRFSSDVMLWVQEAPIRIEEGVCYLPRTDFLIDYRYQMGVWGEINLVNHTLQGSLAITADALRQGFGLKNISDDYALVLKVDGPWNNIQIHKSKALRQIAKLGLLEQTPLKLLPKSGKTPPERKPFPWK